MKIYIFGNPLLKEDSLPLEIIADLRKRFKSIDFIHVDPTENFPPQEERDLIIIDTVKGIKKPMILNLNDLEMIKKNPISPHDYDLMMHLILLIKLKKIDRVTIIGIPAISS